MARGTTHASFSPLNQTVTIAGGGLAGLSLAIALRHRNVPVRILEAGEYPRHRVCGEFISGVSPGTLENLHIAGHFHDARQHRSFSWSDQERVIHRGELPEAALGISRHLLDQRLYEEALSLGCEIITRHRAKPEPADGMVWAAGRRPRPGKWIGLKAHIRGLPVDSDLQMHLGGNGYLGIAGVEDGWSNVCGLFLIDRSLDSKGPGLLPAYLEAGGNTNLATAIRDAEWRPGSFTAVAGFELGQQKEIAGILCLGDARSMIPPFTGNGMSMAFQAAEAAVSPIHEWSSGRSDWSEATKRVNKRLKQKFSRRLISAQLLHPMLIASGGRTFIRSLAKLHALPLRPILSLIR